MGKRKWNEFCGRKFSPIAIVGMVIGGLTLAVFFAFLFGWIVMLLWNWLMPEIFGLPVISYWQGWGLVLLSGILLKGGWGSGGGGDGKRGKEKAGGSDFGRKTDDWCESCDSCDYTENCRPFAHGWIRTADGWKKDTGSVKDDIRDRMKNGEGKESEKGAAPDKGASL